MKRIATMQDISCIGKCSLTVALPVISAMGVETAVLPTAVLSTHTAIPGFTFNDLTDTIRPTLKHWKEQNYRFSAIYTGYLGSFAQIAIAEELFASFGKDALIVVDPCMADNGKLYPGFTQEFADAMAKLCAKADIICPNMTEASFLLRIPYVETYDEVYVQSILIKLTALGCRRAVLTGISLHEGKLGAYGYDAEEDHFFFYETEEQPKHFHGTGDIWASTFTGAMMNDKGYEESIRTACDYVCECIRLTLKDPAHNDYGVNFEQAMPYLLKRLG
ncbi:MAG: pyridoxamine kinase [Bulleidia sp.]|nr:pyridoxamine kinase [Bulleidia sp.]